MSKIAAKLTISTYRQSRGFTLLEMLLVIALLGMMALTATALVDNFGEQDRFDVTKSRLQQIKMAIIGDANRTLNGEMAISGFVADMGRLPNNIEELIEPTGMLWAAIDISGVSGVVGQLYGGWHGPYLDVMPSSGASAVRAFRDGWGNDDGTSNFGWNFVSGVNALSVQSYGSDGPSGVGTDVYEVDYPAPAAGNLVEVNDWALDVSSVNFNIVFNKPPAVDESSLKLRLYFLEEAAVEFEDNDAVFGLSGLTSVSSVQPKLVSISPADPLPMGKYAAVVVCSNADPDLTPFDDNIFNGSCSSSSNHPPYYFTLLPKMQLPINIPWNIQ
ncbi:MAG: prepilin-type N-terminal cleavage/methylation domain-containing protein [Methylotenera sp.]|nr:prepilin-type N-terminal cleavage/methylation domain-containing protein [Methylotenera sp.]